MRKIAIQLVAVVMLLSVLVGLSPAASAATTSIDEQLQTIVSDKLAGADVSIAIRNRTTGELLYALNGTTSIKPASNMKLLTAAAALDVLGEDYRFKTELYTSGKIANGVLKGDVYIKGQGDPTLMASDLTQFAHALKAQGITTIDGRIVGDDKWFDQDLLTPGIWANDESWYYAAPISALTTSPNTDYDSGTVIVDVTPGAVGEAPNVTVTPHIGDLEIVNEAVTVPAGETRTLYVERAYGTNKIVITGVLPLARTYRDWITMQHPTAHTLAMFQEILAQEGIRYTKHKVFEAATPKSAQLIATKQSMPLSELLIPYMKLSNNGIADILVKTMGKVKGNHGSTAAGLKVVKAYGQSIGLDMNKWLFEDGSGMSHDNRVSSETVSQLLFAVQQEPWYATYVTSLPVAGAANRMVGGTLRTRLTNPITAGNVIGKTGSLTGVAALSGYVHAQSGNDYIFSILVQNKSNAATAIDEMVKVIASEF